MVPPMRSLLCGCVPYSLGTTPSARHRETRYSSSKPSNSRCELWIASYLALS